MTAPALNVKVCEGLQEAKLLSSPDQAEARNGLSRRVAEYWSWKPILQRVLKGKAELPTNPLVSVVLGAYNAERTLPLVLRGLRQQSYTNWELVAVDDCSTDSTGALLRAAAAEDSRIRYYRRPRNGGVYRARNYGVFLARGEYIALHDADDVSRPHRLLTAVALLERHRAADFYVSKYRRTKFEDFDDLNEVYRGGRMSEISAASVFRRSFFEHPSCGLFTERIRYAMDYYHTFRVRHVKSVSARLCQYVCSRTTAANITSGYTRADLPSLKRWCAGAVVEYLPRAVPVKLVGELPPLLAASFASAGARGWLAEPVKGAEPSANLVVVHAEGAEGKLAADAVYFAASREAALDLARRGAGAVVFPAEATDFYDVIRRHVRGGSATEARLSSVARALLGEHFGCAEEHFTWKITRE